METGRSPLCRCKAVDLAKAIHCQQIVSADASPSQGAADSVIFRIVSPNNHVANITIVHSHHLLNFLHYRGRLVFVALVLEYVFS